MKPTESFIEQPVRSLQTMLRTIAAENSRYPQLVPDGIYGPGTMYTVSAFQKIQGLPVTGITDRTTWDTIVPIYQDALIRSSRARPIEIIMDPGKVYRAGDVSPYIYLMQAMLTSLSEDYPAISQPGNSGILDADTVSSLRDFQTIAGLPDTGNADKITWKNLTLHFSLNAHHKEHEHKNIG